MCCGRVVYLCHALQNKLHTIQECPFHVGSRHILRPVKGIAARKVVYHFPKVSLTFSAVDSFSFCTCRALLCDPCPADLAWIWAQRHSQMVGHSDVCSSIVQHKPTKIEGRAQTSNTCNDWRAGTKQQACKIIQCNLLSHIFPSTILPP